MRTITSGECQRCELCPLSQSVKQESYGPERSVNRLRAGDGLSAHLAVHQFVQIESRFFGKPFSCRPFGSSLIYAGLK
jgi:hypothetical protein